LASRSQQGRARSVDARPFLFRSRGGLCLDPSRSREITRFVRDTLGCQCPDDVFASISLDRELAPDGATPISRLLIGDRLLIYILQARSAGATADALAALAKQGQAECDAQGYNRFRLVIASPDVEAQSAAARPMFENAIGQDDRAHLHVVSGDEIPISIRTP
jgi:hypothetical protein